MAFKPIAEYEKILIKDQDSFDRMLEDLEREATHFGFDVETNHLNTLVAKLVGASFYWGSGKAYYATSEVILPRLELLQYLFKRKFTICQNIKYEAQIGYMHGWNMFEAGHGRWSDTLVEDYVVDADQDHGLKDQEKRYFGWERPNYEDLFGDIPLDMIAPERIADYGCLDSISAYELHYFNKERLKGLESVLALDLAVIPVISRMEHQGFRMDVDFLSAYSLPLAKKILETQELIYQLAGTQFDIASPAQCGEILFDVLKLPPVSGRTKTGKWKTSALVLDQLSNRHPIVPKITEYRELVKMKLNYVDSILERLGGDGICRASYLTCLVPTGRLASTKGNLTGGACNIQQIPKRGQILVGVSKLTPEEVEVYKRVGATLEPIEGTESSFNVELPVKPRRAFIARNGYYLLSADYKAIEFRIILMMSNERRIVEEILGGVDVHVATAADIFGIPMDLVTPDQREAAKTLNYAVLYGMNYTGLMTRLKITEEEAKLIFNRFMLRIPNIQAWIKEVQNFAKREKYIKTYFGRKRIIYDLIKYKDIPDPKERRKLFQRGLRGSVNSVVQGTGADIMRMALVRIDEAIKPFGDDVHFLGNMHDQGILEVRKEIPKNDMMGVIRGAMEFPVEGWDLPIEIEFETGKNWGDVKKCFYEHPNRSALDVKVSGTVTSDMLLRTKKILAKYPGSYPVTVHMGGREIQCKETVIAADDVSLGLKGIYGSAAEVSWRQ